MSIKNKADMPHRKIEVDLTGPQGNAFCLLGMARDWARQLHLDWAPIEKDAMSGDYEHLLKVLDSHFGTFVDFVR